MSFAQSLQIDGDGNFIRSNNKFIFCPDLQSYVSQKIQIALQKFMGEYFLDASDEGVPWFTYLNKGTSINIIDSKIKDEIISVNYVQGITAYSSSFNSATRTFTITFTAQLTDGSTVKSAVSKILGGF